MTTYGNPTDINGDFARKRAKLVRDERLLRFDTDVIANATAKEKTAAEIVDKIRLDDIGQVGPPPTLSYPGMGFLATKDNIMKTKLYNVMKRFPKGGLLRTHMPTMCEPKMILDLALQYPSKMHVRAVSEFKGPDKDQWPAPEFRALSAIEAAANVHNPPPTDPNYVRNTWVPLGKARAEFRFGGPAGFDEWILRSLGLSAEERSRDNNTPGRAWGHLRISYRAAQGIICYEPILKSFLRQMLISLVEDGISYSEIRANFSTSPNPFTREDGSELPHRDFLVMFRDAIDEVKRDLESAGRKDEFIGAKVIYNVFRSLGPKGFREHLRNCMALKVEFPDLIAGFDFFGPEDIGRPLSNFVEPLLWFQQETKKKGLDIPLLFLVGETIEDGNSADANIYDAVLLGARRLGHGLNITKHPLVMQMIKERGVAIEACPIANDNLGLTSTTHHPLRTLLNNGIPVALCSDNPGAFRNIGLSFDFYQVIASSIATSILSLKQLAYYSLEYSTLDHKEKEAALQAWERRWNVFVEGIIKGDIGNRPLARL